jgi:hypothetical protein
MVIYRVSFFTSTGQHIASEYYAGSVIAHAAAPRAEEREENQEVDTYDVPLTREGMLNALHQFGSHADKSRHAESKSKK